MATGDYQVDTSQVGRAVDNVNSAWEDTGTSVDSLRSVKSGQGARKWGEESGAVEFQGAYVKQLNDLYDRAVQLRADFADFIIGVKASVAAGADVDGRVQNTIKNIGEFDASAPSGGPEEPSGSDTPAPGGYQ